MRADAQSLLKAIEDLKGCLLQSLNKNGAERQLNRELCRQKLNEVSSVMNLTRDDHESIDSAIDKDENLAITLIDRAVDFYRPE